jgi:hypothetical protein
MQYRARKQAAVSSVSRLLTRAVLSVNREIGNGAHKSKDAWVRIDSSVQFRQEAH